MSTELTVHKLPTLTELYDDKDEMLKNSQLNKILNSEPKSEWVLTHPMNAKLKYLPIGRVEYLLTVIFGEWRVEVLDTKVLANSLVVTVRLYVRDPLKEGEWRYNDGVGAQPIQVNKDAGAIDFNEMKSNAVQIGLPAAESYAVKDAAEKFGRMFGKDLNRKDDLGYAEQLGKQITALENADIPPLNDAEFEKVSIALNDSSDLESLNSIWLNLSEKQRQDKRVKELAQKIKASYEK